MRYLFTTDENNIITSWQTCNFLDEAIECDQIKDVVLYKTKLSIVDGKAVLDNSGDYTDTRKKARKEREIAKFKKLLADSDYKAIKYFEGELTEEEFAPIKADRKKWRAKINELEGE